VAADVLRGRIPKQQGLKLSRSPIWYGATPTSRAHSKTTRIETGESIQAYVQVYGLRGRIPKQQGLKHGILQPLCLSRGVIFEGAFQNNKD